MKSWIQAGLFFLFIALIVELVLFVPENTFKGENPFDAVTATSKEEIQQVMMGVHLVETLEGQKEWELWAKQAFNYKESQSWELSSVRVIFFTETGDKYIVTGEKGLVASENKSITISGGVVVRSQNGYKFSTKMVKYSSETRKIVGPEKVEMLGPRDVNGRHLYLVGDSMQADMTSSEILISGNVRSQKDFANDRLVKIKSEEALFSGKAYRSTFLGDVIIDSDNMRITGPRADFQFDPGSDQVVSIKLKGGIRVSDADKWATAESLTAFFDQNKFIFKGSPRVVQDADELRGDEIIFIDGGKKVKVDFEG